MLLGKNEYGAGKYQDYLPSLPVPPLKKTMKRYLLSLKPLLTDEQYQQTKKCVEDFQKKDGIKLQRYLKLRSWTHRNWISAWWDEYVYLRQRTPISFNSNYFSLGTVKPVSPYPLDRAAELIYYGVKYLKDFHDGKVYSMKAANVVPFCYNGMKYSSNTARIPGKEVDQFVLADHTKVYHSVVIRQGKFYKIQVATEDGRLIPSVLIKKQLEKVVEMAGDELDETGVMTFTARPRTEWAEIRERLEKDPLNKETLHMIDSCYQVISLETESPPIDDFTERAKAMFHGNLYNRWFDKGISVSVFNNGLVGCNIEHSPLDATFCAQIWEYMLQKEEYDEDGHVLEASVDGFPTDIQPQELIWE
jgi:carnitine O-palmitoyltransferase 1